MRKKGFTLVETLIAVTILTLSVTGSFFVANNALIAAATSRDRLTASYLAQEGIEYVRMKRDNTYLAAAGTSISPAAWSILFTSNDYKDGLLDVIPAPFMRTVQATPITDTNEKIVSTVSWSYHGNTYSVTITDHLTPWQ